MRLTILLIILLTLSPAPTRAQAENKANSDVNPAAALKLLKEKLAVTDAEKSEYQEITKASKIKIGKVWNYPCEVKKGVVDAKAVDCNSQRALMEASNLVFQPGVRSGKVYSGIVTINGEILAYSFNGLLQMLVDLGEVDLTLIDKETSEIKTLKSVPVYDDKDAVTSANIEKGIEYKNLKIAQRHPLLLNHTYLLRSMDLRSHSTGSISTVWRIENIYAFRVVKFENNIATVIWKELQSKS